MGMIFRSGDGSNVSRRRLRPRGTTHAADEAAQVCRAYGAGRLKLMQTPPLRTGLTSDAPPVLGRKRGCPGHLRANGQGIDLHELGAGFARHPSYLSKTNSATQRTLRNGHRVHREKLDTHRSFRVRTNSGQGDAEGAEKPGSRAPVLARRGFYRSGKSKRRPKRAVMGRPSSGPPLREKR